MTSRRKRARARRWSHALYCYPKQFRCRDAAYRRMASQMTRRGAPRCHVSSARLDEAFQRHLYQVIEDELWARIAAGPPYEPSAAGRMGSDYMTYVAEPIARLQWERVDELFRGFLTGPSISPAPFVVPAAGTFEVSWLLPGRGAEPEPEVDGARDDREHQSPR